MKTKTIEHDTYYSRTIEYKNYIIEFSALKEEDLKERMRFVTQGKILLSSYQIEKEDEKMQKVVKEEDLQKEVNIIKNEIDERIEASKTRKSQVEELFDSIE